MSTFENRPNTALIVCDVQSRVVEGVHERDAVVANIGNLVEKARQERIPVVWVQHSDEQLARGDGWQIVPELTPGDAEPLVEKNYGRLRGHDSRDRFGEPRSWATCGRRRPDR